MCPALTMHFCIHPLSLPVQHFDEIGAIIFLFIVKKPGFKAFKLSKLTWINGGTLLQAKPHAHSGYLVFGPAP